MQELVLAIFGCVTIYDALVHWLDLPSIMRFLPEIFSGLVIPYVLFAGTRDRFRLVAPKYWFVFGALAIVVLCGIINNNPGQAL